MATSNQYRFRRTLSQPISEILADPFSELTRKRQTALLIAASTTLLLAAKLVTVGEVGFGTAKISIQTPEIAKWLSFYVTCYLMTVYALGVWADFTVSVAKKWSPLATIQEVRAGLHQEVKLQIETDEKDLEDHLHTRDELNRLIRPQNEILTKLVANFKEIADQGDSISKETIAQTHQIMKDLKESDVVLQPIWQKLNAPDDPDMIIARHERMRELNDVTGALKNYSKLTRLRLIVETLFPLAFGLFTLLWTFRNR